MHDKIYTANLFKQILNIIGRTLYILFAATIIVHLVGVVFAISLPSAHLNFDFLDDYWNKYFVFFIPIILGYSILYTFKLNKIQVYISNKTMFVLKNCKEEQYNLLETVVKLENVTTSTLGSQKVLSKYVMKTLSPNGSVNEYDLLAFNKNTFNDLSDDIAKIKKEVNQ